MSLPKINVWDYSVIFVKEEFDSFSTSEPVRVRLCEVYPPKKLKASKVEDKNLEDTSDA